MPEASTRVAPYRVTSQAPAAADAPFAMLCGTNATPAWDMVTGWGAINFNAFVSTQVSTTPDFTVSASPGSQTVVQGSGTSYTATVGALGGFTVASVTDSGDKRTRFGPFSSQCRAGNVKILRGPWNEDLFRASKGSPISTMRTRSMPAA